MQRFNVSEISRLLNTPAIDRSFTGQEQELFDRSKRELLAEFDAHPVTQEIAGGADSSNISGTLGGIGNLFTFIGFPNGEDPIGPLRNLLIEGVTLGSAVRTPTEDGWQYKFPIFIPSEEIYSLTPLPFETGNSWVIGIEEGISGLSNFLFQASKASRSGKGIETKEPIRSTSFSPQPYLPSMLKSFVEKLGITNSFTFDL